jgi:hypothetical protein
MAISDYAHHNEEAKQIWWLEEGRHETFEEPYDDDPDAGWDDWEDFDDDEDEAIEPEDWYREDLGWAGCTE